MDETFPTTEASSGETATADQIRERLLQQAPELLDGRLPAVLERRLGDRLYALGTHQSRNHVVDGTVGTIAEAKQTMDILGGIAALDGSIATRFQLVDNPESAAAAGTSAEQARAQTEQAVVNGYYGVDSGMGKYVYAFPVHRDDSLLGQTHGVPRRVVELNWYNMDPNDATGQTQIEDVKIAAPGQEDNPEASLVYNPKFCAGFIDIRGDFYANSSFGTEDAFNPVPIVDTMAGESE